MTDAEFEKLRTEALRYIHEAEKRGQRVLRSRKYTAIIDRLSACRYCGKKNEVPMLKSDVWLKALPDGHGCLCLGCFEKRLGRPLAPEDCGDPEDFPDLEDFGD